ncbi:hypothetical protein EIN_275050 [Entamoeba invadens IP1]|uniref:Uncharacterized protein n=1 Tax=Entamoeba invadens IP1 TaxID=370355 RepID=A0A0A1U4V8_ENTIV|nr:hypothetical protein EIN_275050 [Entamoeba invadens IP1]ELP87918.1 hypothetical protein EIN_275050 [Entamoeba invadens IP1]|eukprot:XP_004254689.1 hypothetical protein EIN_275050 [Entamoeba invadens IP1]
MNTVNTLKLAELEKTVDAHSHSIAILHEMLSVMTSKLDEINEDTASYYEISRGNKLLLFDLKEVYDCAHGIKGITTSLEEVKTRVDDYSWYLKNKIKEHTQSPLVVQKTQQILKDEVHVMGTEVSTLKDDLKALNDVVRGKSLEDIKPSNPSPRVAETLHHLSLETKEKNSKSGSPPPKDTTGGKSPRNFFGKLKKQIGGTSKEEPPPSTDTNKTPRELAKEKKEKLKKEKEEKANQKKEEKAKKISDAKEKRQNKEKKDRPKSDVLQQAEIQKELTVKEKSSPKEPAKTAPGSKRESLNKEEQHVEDSNTTQSVKESKNVTRPQSVTIDVSLVKVKVEPFEKTNAEKFFEMGEDHRVAVYMPNFESKEQQKFFEWMKYAFHATNFFELYLECRPQNVFIVCKTIEEGIDVEEQVYKMFPDTTCYIAQYGKPCDPEADIIYTVDNDGKFVNEIDNYQLVNSFLNHQRQYCQ